MQRQTSSPSSSGPCDWLHPQGRSTCSVPYNCRPLPGSSHTAIYSSWIRGRCTTCKFCHTCILSLENHQARSCSLLTKTTSHRVLICIYLVAYWLWFSGSAQLLSEHLGHTCNLFDFTGSYILSFSFSLPCTLLLSQIHLFFIYAICEVVGTGLWMTGSAPGGPVSQFDVVPRLGIQELPVDRHPVRFSYQYPTGLPWETSPLQFSVCISAPTSGVGLDYLEWEERLGQICREIFSDLKSRHMIKPVLCYS